MKTKINLFVIVCCFVSLIANSQQQNFSGTIKNDSIIGFKKIRLTPTLRTVAKTNFNDLRIYDAQKNQVPYFIQEREFEKVDYEFTSIQHKIKHFKKRTNVVINNSTEKLYGSFIFKISNAIVHKRCKIEGSNDNKNWFVISERLYLNLYKSTKKGYNYYNINFPSITYKNIRLVVNNSYSAPINITDIGYFKRKVTSDELKYQKLNYTYKVSTKEKKTTIHVTSNSPFEINKIDFNISQPKLFNRNVSIYSTKTIDNKLIKHSINSIVLNSKSTNFFKGLNIKKQDFIIEIDNQDNPNLLINSIGFYQKEKYIITELKPNQSYNIVAGDKKLKRPSYDIYNFIDDINYNHPLLNIANVKTEKQKTVTITKEKKFYEQPMFMWICIGIVGLILLYFTISLLKKTDE